MNKEIILDEIFKDAETTPKKQAENIAIVEPTAGTVAGAEQEENPFIFSDLYQKPNGYFERQRNSIIKVNKKSPFFGLDLYSNKLIGFSGIPGSSKTTLCLNIIQDIIDSNSNYKAVLFSLELNRDTTVSKLAKIPVYFPNGTTPEQAENYNLQDQNYTKKYILSGKIGIIDRATNIKNDIKVLKEILEDFKNRNYTNKPKALESYQDLIEYRNQEIKEEKLLIFIDYFDIMRVEQGLTGETDYRKEAYLIENLKTFRDRYNFATFFIINSTNKTGLSTAQNQSSIKGNSAIIFGYDQSFAVENIKGKVKDEKAKKEAHPHHKIVNNYKFISFESSKLRENQTYKDENFYSNEGLIILEDTKNRFSGKCTHFYKAIKGYSAFIKLDSSAGNGSNQETDKKAGNKNPVNYSKGVSFKKGGIK